MTHNHRHKCSFLSRKLGISIIVFSLFLFPILSFATTITATDTVSVSATVVGGGGGTTGSSTGGGGGVVLTTPTSIVFSGQTSPNSQVTLFEDGQQINTTTSGYTGAFLIAIPSLTGGTYTFSIVSQDPLGHRSAFFTIPIAIPNGVSTTVANIALTIVVTTPTTPTTPTSSPAIPPTTTNTQLCSLRSDINHDCRVNLVDFSILMYWYRHGIPPKNVDLNGDGKITMVDFSILAYYWTA